MSGGTATLNIDTMQHGTLGATHFDLAHIAKNSLAYIIHTSGTTGIPKGVCVSVANLENLLKAMQKRFPLDKNDRLLAITTISFDISILELFLPLLSGSTVVIATDEEVLDGYLLAEILTSYKITIMQATPSSWRMLLVSGWQGSGILTALCGGEVLDPQLAQDLAPIVGSLWNMYGPTETTIWSTCCQISESSNPITVGTPIDNTEFLIVDETLTPVVGNDKGELLISGAGVSSGYTDSTLNHDRFTTLTTADGQIVKYYRTGDVASITQV